MFNFGTNLGLTEVIYFIKINFDIKIKIDIFEILNVPNFNKFLALFILGPNWAKQVVKYLMKIIFDIKIETGIFEISNVLNFNKS